MHNRAEPDGYESELPVLGVPVCFRSNSPDAMHCVERVFGRWKALAGDPHLVSKDHATVRVIVESTEQRPGGSAEILRHLPDRDRLVLSSANEVACADITRRDAFAYVTPASFERSDYFRYNVLEALTLFLVTTLDRQPLHAAAVVRDGVGLLLCGPSGAGKSTLCYAALRNGLQVLSDEAIYIQQEPTLRLWALPGRLTVAPGARAHFAELGAAQVWHHPSGKEKIRIDLAAQNGIPGKPFVERAGICILGRGDASSLTRLSPTEVRRRVDAQLEPGFDRFRESLGPAIERIAAMGSWELTLGQSPQAAVPFMLQALEAVAGVG